ncbi:MAG: GyrI-like domain-containing protein [Clostridia bacterium]|nr:GyrI-like domain-containing protein [Clostridia bacterium]
MKIEKITKKSFTVIGKEGSTRDGQGFIQKLWENANGHFHEVVALAQKDENGNIAGIWGAMSDFSRSFKPWEEHFSQGIYLAGIECPDGTEAPEGWQKWIIPGFEYLRIECEDEQTFSQGIAYMKENHIPLAGAVHDFTCPGTGKNYMLFPIAKLP